MNNLNNIKFAFGAILGIAFVREIRIRFDIEFLNNLDNWGYINSYPYGTSFLGALIAFYIMDYLNI